MNILIIGGLALVALVALLGAILLSIGEERAEKEAQQAKSIALLSELSPNPPQTPFPTVVVRPADSLNDQAAPGALMPLSEEAQVSALHGQLYSITDELRTLTQRTGELERRLSGLTALLERRQVSEVASQLHTSASDITTL
ncbi:MAG: hypothetical protein ACRDHW_06790 [Ktedonobacteraceae bacterium]